MYRQLNVIWEVYFVKIKTTFTYGSSPGLFTGALAAGAPDPLGSIWIRKHVVNTTMQYTMSLVLKKPVFGVSDQVQHKLGCAVTEDG